MDHADVMRTLQLLSDGRDPKNGLPLPDGSPYNQPAVLRSLFAAMRALERIEVTDRHSGCLDNTLSSAATEAVVGITDGARRSASATRAAPSNAGKPWNSVEDEALCSEFEQGLDAKELAARHGRSRTAVNARLFKLGKIADPGTQLRHPVQGAKPNRGAAPAVA